MATKRLLIRGGSVLSMDPAVGDHRVADVLVEGSKIVAVGPHLAAADCEVIGAAGMIVMPGMVDGHKHVWQSIFRSMVGDVTLTQFFGEMVPALAPVIEPEDVYASELLGTVDALNAGVTCFLDWCHMTKTPAHARAAVKALKESGARVWFAHGQCLTEWGDPTADHDPDVAAIQKDEFASDGGLVRLALAARGLAWTDLPTCAREFGLARRMGIPISLHVSMPGYPPADELGQLFKAGLLGPDVAILHGGAITVEEIRNAASVGTKFVDSGQLDVLMGIGPAITSRLGAAGVKPGISVDTITGNAGDLFWAMRAQLLLERQRVYAPSWESGNTASEPHLTAREMVERATIGGANACWLADTIGSLTPGKEADIVLLRTTDFNMVPASDMYQTIVEHAHSGNVDTVLVGGTVVKRQGEMVSVDPDRVRRLAVAARDRVYKTAHFKGCVPA